MKLVLMLGAVSLAMLGCKPAPSPRPVEEGIKPASADTRRAEGEHYVGADSCKRCHYKHHGTWARTTMAKAFDSLKPGNAAEAKKKSKLDVKMDYTKDANCVECHTTGYGKPGGYPVIVEGKTWTDDETKRATAMENVQCESCHGPGSLTNVHKKDHENYAKADLLKMGMVNPDEANCKTCHNERCPTVPRDYKFDYAASTRDAMMIHEHVPLQGKH